MNVAQNGELQELPESELHDEIGQLIHSYNYMVQQQKMLMEEKYRLGESAKMAELRALQSQNQPAFSIQHPGLGKVDGDKGGYFGS